MPATRWPKSASFRRSARKDDLGKGRQGDVRRGADRRDRARDQARRHRLPDAPGRDRRPGSALRPSGHDLVGRARHLPHRAAGQAPPTCCSPISTRLLAALKKRAFEHKDTVTIGRSHGIHAEPTTFGVKLAQAYAEFAARAHAAGRGARRDRDLRHFRRGRHVRQHRPARRRACRAEAGAEARAGLDPGDPARPARDVLRHARRDRLVGRAARDRDPPPAADGSAGGGGVFLAGPEGLVGDAAQAQSGADREPDRPGAAGARLWRCRRWRTWRSGTSATSRIPRSSG